MLRCNKINISILLILFLSISFFALNARAQTPSEIIDSIQNNIQISISPEFPKAGDTVTIHLESYSTPLNQAKISYIVNGSVAKSGIGATDFITSAGAVGSTSRVLVRILTANGQTVEKTITLQPVDVDLLWQATSYVPSFYEGKAMYPHQGLITFTAVPNTSTGGNIAKSIGSYIYTWKKDGDILGDFSGYGKSTFSMRGTIISRAFTMEVDVSTKDGVSIGSAATTIRPQSPQIVFYEYNPTLGILYNHSLSNTSMAGKELSIYAAPYFFNSGSEPQNLQYQWDMNGQTISSQQNPSVLTVRNTSNAGGNSNISLQISNALKTLQFTSKSMSVTFTQDNSTAL